MNPMEVQKKLEGMDYPATKADLITKAKENNADEKMISMLEKLPDDEYNSPADVSEELGNMM